MEELLRNAAARGDSEQVVRLLKEGAKNVPDENGRNALHVAAAAGNVNVINTLLQIPWNINLQDSAGCTALHKAAVEGHIEVVRQLIKHGANVNIQDKVNANTALHEASWRGYSKCVEALCQTRKINLHVKNAGGFAPLHLACQNGHNQSCRELLIANCNPDIQNNYGDTPLHTSARYGHAGVTRILISADCHMSDQNKNGDTALHITAAMGRRKLTRILLESGCDPHKRNKQNETAKDIAIRKDLTEIIQIIEKTTPLKKKEKQLEKKEKENRPNDKKRGKESGSSKDSSTRPKGKKKPKSDHQVHFENVGETSWSPYGCHYYPDSKTFPKPKLDSLPHEPLKKGEQYYLDLAGNIRKGPVGVGYTCYCAPFFRHMEERLNRDKKELKQHIDAAQLRLDKKVTNLEVKTRSQLNEITRSMALERAKCQQRHLHLEQWLIRGTIFRNSEKVKPSDFTSNLIPKSKSLENVLEGKVNYGVNNFHKSADILNAHEDPHEINDDLKNRSSSREGKESGKGSSEIGDLGSSDGEGKLDSEKEMRCRGGHYCENLDNLNKHERQLKRTTREISERIDQILKRGENADGMGTICDEMLKWKSYHNAYNERSKIAGQHFEEVTNKNQISDKENQRTSPNTPVFHRPQASERIRHIENRRSYHDLLKEHESNSNQEEVGEGRIRRLSDPRGLIEGPQTTNATGAVSKSERQQTVKELVAKIQKKTGLIHKSAQKWKENKLKNKEKINKFCEGKTTTETLDQLQSKSDETVQNDIKVAHNYENLRHWDVPQEKLLRLPYRCRNTVYSPSLGGDPSDDKEYQRLPFRSKLDADLDDRLSYSLDPTTFNYDKKYGSTRERENIFHAGNNPIQNSYAPAVDVENDLYEYEHPSKNVFHPSKIGIEDQRRVVRSGQPHNYSPTQNDSGYSTKPYGGSSTGPSPSLSGRDLDCGSTEMKAPHLPLPVYKSKEGKSASLV